jgi:hypothetical protein
MTENDGFTAARRRPPYALAVIARRVKSAERHIERWCSTHPLLPRAEREHLARLLLAEDDQPGGAE